MSFLNGLHPKSNSLANHACCPTLYRDDKAVYCGPPFKPVFDQYRKIIAAEAK